MRSGNAAKWKRFHFACKDQGINPGRVGWWARQHYGLLKLNGRQFFTKFELSKLKGGVWRADFRRKNAAKWKRFHFACKDRGINPGRVGWWVRQHYGFLKLNGRPFFTKFDISKLKGGVWRADFRRKNAAKWKLATLRGSSSKTGGLRENSFQILTHLSGVSHVSYLVKTRILSL